MLVLNLACSHDHRFEGWFGSNADFESQLERGLLSCPVCADASVKRMPSAPHLNASHLRTPAAALAKPQARRGPQETGAQRAPAAQAGAAPPAPPKALAPIEAAFDPQQQMQILQAKLLQAVQHVIAATEDVGTQFAEEARRIHYGEAEERGIRGQATPDEAAALQDEGIDVQALPLVSGHKGTLQ